MMFIVIDEFKQLANVNSCLFVFAYADQILSYNIIIIARDHIVMRGITVKTIDLIDRRSQLINTI